MKLLYIVLFLLFFCNSEYKKTKTIPDKTKINLPKSFDGDTIYYRDGFCLSYSEKWEQPKWIFYTLKKSDINCSTKIKRKNYWFQNDYNIKTGSSTLEDYKNTGYDRGHLKPSADESCDLNQMKETFLMSNMSPQLPEFNRYIWKNLESYVRKNVFDYDSIQIVTGGNLNEKLAYIGINKVGVPKHFYKVLIKFKNNKKTIECFYLPNKKNENFNDFKITKEELEKIIKIKID